ncbi:GldG family protein [Candidatus Binatia bacterium]|nr:GldG family protein [Candidatus Binatia bacterium]
MHRSQSLLGIVGLLLLFFGGISVLFTGRIEAYALIHLGVGIVLLAIFLFGSFKDLGKLLSARSTKYGTNMVVYSLLFIALLVGVNWFGARHNKRWDVSESGVFTLSPQAKNVLAGLDKDVEMQAFLEGGHDPEIEALFESFAYGSPRVKTTLVDPDKQPELTEKYGVRAYRTVRVAYGENSTTVSQPSEETLTNALIKVTKQTAQMVCFLDGEGEPDIDDQQTSQGFAEAKAALTSENYQTKKLVLIQEGKVPDDCNIVVVAAPERALLPQQVDAIAAFLKKGGKAVFMLPPRQGNELSPLLAEYGVKLGNDAVVDQVVRLFQGPQLGLNPIVSTYGAHPITKDIKERTVFPLTRSVDVGQTKPGLTVVSLAKTSQSSWAETDLTTLFDAQSAVLEESDVKGPVSIAAAVDADLKKLGTGEGDARLVVFGTAAFADNKNINTLYNRDLFLNSVGWLSNQEELLSIRPRTVRASRVEFSEEQATAIFYLSVLVIPELLMIIGLAVWWRRSSL